MEFIELSVPLIRPRMVLQISICVEFMNSVQNNTVSVNQTSFSGNSCLETYADKSSGGGLVLGFMFYPGSWVHKSWPPMGKSFKCSYCTFEEKQCLYIWVVEQGYTPQKTSFVTPISLELFSPTVTGQTTGLPWEQLCLLHQGFGTIVQNRWFLTSTCVFALCICLQLGQSAIENSW